MTPHGSNAVQDTLLATKQRGQQYEEARQRQIRLNKQIDANILVQQREHRRERVAANFKRREEDFRSVWATKKLQDELDCLNKHGKSWMLTKEFSLEQMKSSPIHAVPFQAALVSCGLSLDANEFEKMFHAMAHINNLSQLKNYHSCLTIFVR